MTDYYEKINAAARDAEARGWVRLRGQYNPTWYRTVEHVTPAKIKDYGWWTGETYFSRESVAFILRERDRAPRAVYNLHRTHWTPSSARSVSFKKALEILAAETADVHENHWEG